MFEALIAACPSLLSMDRVELIHPMLVHFPIALLAVGGVMRLMDFFLGRIRSFSFLRPTSLALLVIGVVMAWITVVAGEAAATIVAPSLCDGKVLDSHSSWGYLTATGFSLVLFLDRMVGWMDRHFKSQYRVVVIATHLILLASIVGIIVTGIFGAKLVYQQGAATVQCLGR